MPSFWSQWSAWYPSDPPIGYLLRMSQFDHWLRIHNFGADTRYAETAAEVDQALHRNNVAATKALGPKSECLLFYATFGDRDVVPTALQALGLVPIRDAKPPWTVDSGW